jgi:peptide-methionine (S)-S-oxide reductase
MRQGNDVGSQYRSGIYYFDELQHQQASSALEQYQQLLAEKGFPAITTEVLEVGEFYYAENYHQQYLAKNPNGYCGIGGTGISCSLE